MRSVIPFLALSCLLSTPLVAAPQNPPATNADAATQVDFKKRVDAYIKVHNEAKKSVPPLKETHEAAEIKLAQDALGAKIRELRADAKQGDILTREIAARVRELLVPPLKSADGRRSKEVLKDDAPKPAEINFQVNAKYPSQSTVTTMPARVLLSLPTLPKEIEYRIIGKALILRDTEADIIADFMPNAIP